MLVTMFPRQAGILIVFSVVLGAVGGGVCHGQSPQPNVALSSPIQNVVSGRALYLDGGTAAVDGVWKFHLGDNPVWASPELDDSGWEDMAADKPWGMQGYRSVDRFAWYRR